MGTNNNQMMHRRVRTAAALVAVLTAPALIGGSWVPAGAAVVDAGTSAAGSAAPRGPAPRAIFLTGPADHSPTREAEFSFEADQPGVRYSVRLDHGDWSRWSRSPAARFTALSQSGHVVALRAESSEGHVGPVTRTRFAVDLTRPRTSFGGDRRPATALRPSTALRLTSSEPGSSFSCKVDHGSFRPCASPYVLEGMGAGRHRLSVRATDPAGNTDASPTSRAVTLDPDATSAPSSGGSDTTAPRTTITTAPVGKVLNGSAAFSFTSSEQGSFECSLDDAAYSPCSSPQRYSSLTKGAHTFSVRAIDAPGNVDNSPATSSLSSAVTREPAVLIADNQNRRILITDYDGKILWKFDNPTGESSAYSGPLGVRWLDNGHILATFGTGKVGEIDPATKTFVWVTAGYNGLWFQSPYDAQILPDGNLAVALARNGSGRVRVFNRRTGAMVWNYRINYPHLVEMIPAGKGTHTSRPTLLMAGFSKLTEAIYHPGHADNKAVAWQWAASSNVHRAILASDGHSVVVTNRDDLVKVARPKQKVTWRRFQGNCCHGETRGVAITDTGGYVLGHRVWNGASQIRFTDPLGRTTKTWTTLSDGSRLNLVWGVRTLRYPG